MGASSSQQGQRPFEKANNRDGLLLHDAKFSSRQPGSFRRARDVKEDKHPNFMGSVVLKKGIEEPWALERVLRFIDSLGYLETTLQSDAEPAIIAVSSRVAEGCRACVTTGDAVKGNTSNERLHRVCRDAVARNHPNEQVSHGKFDDRTSQRGFASAPMAGGTHRQRLVQVSERARWFGHQ